MRMSESICQQIMNNKFDLLFIHIEFRLLLDSLLAMKINGVCLQHISDTQKRTVDHLVYRIRSNLQFFFQISLSIYRH